MTDSQREILLHTLGLSYPKNKLPCRNYFNSKLSGKTYEDCMALVEQGLMRRGREIEGQSAYFAATVEGVQHCLGIRVSRQRIEQWFKTNSWKRRRI